MRRKQELKLQSRPREDQEDPERMVYHQRLHQSEDLDVHASTQNHQNRLTYLHLP